MSCDSPIAGRLRKTTEKINYFKHSKTKTKEIIRTENQTIDRMIVCESQSNRDSTSIFEYFASDFEEPDSENIDPDSETIDPDSDSENFYDPDEADDNVFVSAMALFSVVEHTPLTMVKTERGGHKLIQDGFYYVVARKSGF